MKKKILILLAVLLSVTPLQMPIEALSASQNKIQATKEKIPYRLYGYYPILKDFLWKGNQPAFTSKDPSDMMLEGEDLPWLEFAQIWQEESNKAPQFLAIYEKDYASMYRMHLFAMIKGKPKKIGELLHEEYVNHFRSKLIFKTYKLKNKYYFMLEHHNYFPPVEEDDDGHVCNKEYYAFKDAKLVKIDAIPQKAVELSFKPVIVSERKYKIEKAEMEKGYKQLLKSAK